MNPTLIGVDLAKHSFAVCEANDTGRVLRRHEFKRQAFAAYLAQLPTGTQVAIEACGGAHYWARKCLQYGLVLVGSVLCYEKETRASIFRATPSK